MLLQSLALGCREQLDTSPSAEVTDWRLRNCFVPALLLSSSMATGKSLQPPGATTSSPSSAYMDRDFPGMRPKEHPAAGHGPQPDH